MARAKVVAPVVRQLTWKEKNDFLMWQGYTEGEGIGEPAIRIKGNSDCVSIEQGAADILLNYESIDAFIDILQKLKKGQRG